MNHATDNIGHDLMIDFRIAVSSMIVEWQAIIDVCIWQQCQKCKTEKWRRQQQPDRIVRMFHPLSISANVQVIAW